MDFPVPTASFTRCDQRKAVVSVDMTDLLRTMKDRPVAGSEPRTLAPRPGKVLVQVDGRLLDADLVRSDTVIGSMGEVARVTLMLPDGCVVLLGLDGARELVPKQAVWSVRYDELVKVG